MMPGMPLLVLATPLHHHCYCCTRGAAGDAPSPTLPVTHSVMSLSHTWIGVSHSTTPTSLTHSLTSIFTVKPATCTPSALRLGIRRVICSNSRQQATAAAGTCSSRSDYGTLTYAAIGSDYVTHILTHRRCVRGLQHIVPRQLTENKAAFMNRV